MLIFLWLLSKLQFPPLYSSNFEVYFCRSAASFSLFEIVAILTSDEHEAATSAPPPPPRFTHQSVSVVFKHSACACKCCDLVTYWVLNMVHIQTVFLDSTSMRLWALRLSQKKNAAYVFKHIIMALFNSYSKRDDSKEVQVLLCIVQLFKHSWFLHIGVRLISIAVTSTSQSKTKTHNRKLFILYFMPLCRRQMWPEILCFQVV